MTKTSSHELAYPDPHQDVYDKTVFGFWVYLMTDCVLFGTLFATYAVLHNNTFGGPSAKELFGLPFALTETLLLLISSFTCGLAMLEAQKNRLKTSVILFITTFLFGAGFLAMELTEFTHLVQEGFSWERSAFLSSFFTLVATHGLHITTGLIFLVVLLCQAMRRGLVPVVIKRLMCLSLFWHFLDVVWIFIFTFVYLMGAI